MSADINKMDFKQLRNEVQLLRDELAIFKRKYEDIIYNLDDDNFSSTLLREKDDMKTEIKVTAEGIKTKVSKEDMDKELLSYTTLEQTADAIKTQAYASADLSTATEISNINEATDKTKTYYIKDGNGDKTYYYYNEISKKWEEIIGGGIDTVFEQTPTGFKLKGNVKVDGSCVLTDSLTFDSSDKPLQVEYSIDGVSNWHTTFSSGTDKFMRLKIGADWSDAMKIVAVDGQPGSDATVTPQKVFNVLTNNGTHQGIFNAFVNNGNQLYINAEMIQAGVMRGMTFQNTTGTTSLILGHESGSDVGDLRLIRENSGEIKTTVFMVKDNMFSSISLVGMGSTFLTASASKVTPKGTWDFSSCDVEGIEGSGGTATAVFG